MKQFRPTKFNWWDAPVGTMPRVFYGGGKSQQSTSQVSIPPEVLAQYQNVNSIANQVAQTPFQQYSQDPNSFVAPLTTTQQAGILGTNQYASEAQPFYQAASNLNNPNGVMQYYNPEASQVGALMQQQFNQAQSGQLGNAIQNGAFGGDRAAVTAANLQQQQGLAYGNAMAGIYQNAVGNSQNAANLEANIGAGAQSAGLAGAQAQLTAGQAQQQTEQAGLTALYNQFLQQQSYPFQTTQFLANIAEGTGALSGSTTTSNQPAPYFSDERLKDDIEPIGKTFDGLNIIKFRYKGSKQPHIGLSAQDVERMHPDAVGLAGGYKTVDYDAATRDAAERGRDSQGGLVVPMPFRRLDGSVVHPQRRTYDAGGYAGLSPNSAWSGGFYLDPSYLQAQEAAYASAPWGNAGPVSGSAPYGGKSHVPPSMGGIHASLAVAKPPAEHNSTGLQQLSSGLGQLEKLGGQGKKLFNGVKGYVPGLAPSTTTNTQPTTVGGVTQGNPPPAPHQPPVTPSNDASSGPIAGLDPAAAAPADLGSDVASGLGAAASGATDVADAGTDLGDLLVFASRGGRMRRGLDSGGTPSFSQPTDAGQDDQSSGGDVPYESGTGAGGLGIPDDKPNNKLAVAQPPSSSSGGGLGIGDILGAAGGIAKIFMPFLAHGGRVGLAGGGSPDDQSDLTLPSLGTDLDRQELGLAPAPKPVDQDYVNQGRRSLAQALGMSGYEDTANQGAPSAPVATYNDNSGGLGDIVVRKVSKSAPKSQESASSAPKKAVQELNPDVPAPESQPVQAVQSQGRVTEPGEVLNQDNPGGIGDFLNRNQGLIVPFLHGLGTMASSNSRYLGSAILQGLGGAADSYENVQNEMQQRHGLQPIITERQAESLNQQLVGLAQFNQMNGTHLSLQDYQNYLRTGQLPSQGRANAQYGAQSDQMGIPGRPDTYTYSQYERDHMVLPNGIPAYQDPSYLRGFANKWGGIAGTSPYFRGQVDQANHVAGAVNNEGFTYNQQGSQVTPQGYQSRIMAQAQPATQAQQARDFQGERLAFLNDYQRSMSLFDELGDVYHQFQAGPTADWRGAVSALANDFDPTGQFPFLHNIPAGNDAENYAKARKDIAQLTASRLSTLPGGAPKAELGLLDQYAAEPNLPPGALRDIIIRGKAALQQTHDYYRGLNPFAANAPTVPDYQADFYEKHPYEGYRKQLEKNTPMFAGQTAANSPEAQSNQKGQGRGTAPPEGAPQGARQAPDGKWYVPDPNRPGKYLRVD